MAGTRWIRMIVGVSGYRHDGRPWPPAGGEIEVPDWEADDLIRGQNAVPHEQPHDRPVTPAPVPGEARPASQVEAEEGARRGFIQQAEQHLAEHPGVAETATEEAAGPGPAEVARPAPADVKQAWIDYAVSQGADPETAAAMTKADLMSRYGGRL